MAEIHFDIAVQRLTAWLRDYGEQKPKEFIGDVSIVLLAAKDTYRLEQEIERLRGAVAYLRENVKSGCSLDVWKEFERRIDG